MLWQARWTPIWATREGFEMMGGAVYTVLDSQYLLPLTILRDQIPWKPFNYRVNCHQIKLRLNSGLIFTVTATSEGLFARLQGCFCLLGAITIILHSIFAKYLEPAIVYIISFAVEMSLWQSLKHRDVRARTPALGKIRIWYGIRLHTGASEIKCRR